MKIRKFFEDYGYTIVKMLVTHVACSILGLMLYLPSVNNQLFTLIFGIFSTVFYFFMISNDIWKIGAKDTVRTVRGKNAAHPAKGFLMGLVAAIPDLIICGLCVFFWYFRSYEWAGGTWGLFYFICMLWEGMFFGLNVLITDLWVFILAPFFTIVFAGVCYILGVYNIKLLPQEDNPEEAERRREAQKNKKKFTLFRSKEQEDEDEDELM